MDHSLDLIIRPVLNTFLHKYPDISVEVCCDYSFVDIAAEGFDAGVRLGEAVADGMIATRIGPDMRLSVVGSPAYFEGRTKPETPRDLTAHRCNNLRLPTNGGLYAWEFAKDSETLNVRVTGQVTFNGVYPLLDAALDGFGLSYIPHDLVAEHIEAGRLIQVLEDWSPTFAGFPPLLPEQTPGIARVCSVTGSIALPVMDQTTKTRSSVATAHCTCARNLEGSPFFSA